MITTVSSTRCCASPRPELRRWLALACWLLLLLGALAPAVRAQPQGGGAEITQLRTERSEEGLLLSATVRFELPGVVEDALAKGIPMFFVAEATLLRERWYWYDKPVAQAARHLRLSFQPLTRRWRLQVSSAPISNSGLGLALGQTFDTREEALAAVQRISRWQIAAAQDVDPEVRYNLEFRFRLDVSQLPRPFQIGAVGQSDWQISAARSQRLVIEPAR